MSNLSNMIASRISEIRRSYVEANNRIINRIETAIGEFRYHSAGNAPEISVSVRAYLDSRIRNIREMVVDHIEFGIKKLGLLYHPVDGEGLRSRRFSKSVTDILEQSFEVDQYPPEFEKARLAKVCGLSTKQINNWFTNKRNRTKNCEGSRQC